MKKIVISLVCGFFLINAGYSKDKSKVDEYLNESKDDNFSVSEKQIKNTRVPDANFSLDSKKNVNQEFLSDEFVESIIKDKSQKFSIGNDGDLEFEPANTQKPVYDESVKLKDDDQYTDEEIAQFATMADQYYKFKDFDEYKDYYYYYDTESLEKYKEPEGVAQVFSKKAAGIKNYIASIGNSFFNSQLVYGVSNYYSAATAQRYNVARAAGANISLVDEALNYYNRNSSRFSNRRFMAVLEFSRHSAKSRFYIINLSSKKVVAAYHVSHGSGSDTNNDGYPTYFSNVPNSHASSLGVYKTGEIYNGKYGKSLRLHGLSSTNSNVYSRAVVIHPSPYVKEANVRQGRSWGCMAFDYRVSGDVINMLRGGALIYAKYVR
ncbi:MAG: murein L,D-transpeptidase catalytic domain family protein [Elusimicrobia bacterium]|jgi:hypothetical protein|nr:murein L,D-transpeptidase catalytic domain family protein [Elusimicrobiota bacterium]